MQPLSLGRWSWLWFVATSLVLDSRIQAELSRESWVSEWAVLVCPLRTRVVQSFANNCEDKDCDSPDVTCVIEPSPCRNPLPVQVEEMEVWSLRRWRSGLFFSLKEPTLAPSLIGIPTEWWRRVLRREDCRKTPNVCFVLDLTSVPTPLPSCLPLE